MAAISDAVMDGALRIAGDAWEVVRLAPAWILVLSAVSILLFLFISVRPSLESQLLSMRPRLTPTFSST